MRDIIRQLILEGKTDNEILAIIFADFDSKFNEASQILEKKFGKDALKTLYSQIKEADPTKGDYVLWIVNRLIDGSIEFPKDIKKVNKILDQFEKLKKVAPKGFKKDIESYKSYDELEKAIKEEEGSGLKLLLDTNYKGSHYKIYEILTVPAAMRIGKKNHDDWCIFKREQAEYYLSQDRLIYIEKDGEPHALFHRRSKQWHDRNNHEMSRSEKLEIYPLLKKATGVVILDLENKDILKNIKIVKR